MNGAHFSEYDIEGKYNIILYVVLILCTWVVLSLFSYVCNVNIIYLKIALKKKHKQKTKNRLQYCCSMANHHKLF